MKNKLFFIIVVSLIVAIVGCSNQETEEERAKLYENKQFEITIYETRNWELIEENASEQTLNVTFANHNIKANVSIVNGTRAIEEVKSEIYLEEKMSVIEETNEYLSIKTNSENIRTDIFLEPINNQTMLIAFVAHDDEFSQNENNIDDLKNNIVIANEN